jgi:tetratricopeptide (TPR) repeat protein
MRYRLQFAVVLLAVLPAGSMLAQPVADWQSLTDAGLQAQKQGDFHEARKQLLAAATAAEKLEAGDARRASSIENLLQLFQKYARHEEMAVQYRRLIALRELQLGPNHIEVARTLDRVARFYGSWSERVPASPASRISSPVSQIPSTPLSTPVVRYSVVIVPGHRGGLVRHTREAAQLYARALAIREQQYGAVHAELLPNLVELGQLQLAMYEWGRARVTYDRLLQLQEALPPAGLGTAAWQLLQAGNLMQQVKRYDESETYYRQSLTLLRRRVGDEHPDVATLYNNLGVVHMRKKQYPRAEAELQHALTLYEKAGGANDTRLVAPLENYALLLRKLHREEEARRVLARAAQIRAQA